MAGKKPKSAFDYEVPKGTVVDTKTNPAKYLPNGEINPAWEKKQKAKKK